jgi:hypothetical protein
MLRAKAASLEGYVITDASAQQVITNIRQLQDNIGTRL